MTKAVVAAAYGSPDVLRLVEVDVAAPGPGEVTIEVRAAGVNPADVKAYSGVWGKDPDKLPMRLGFEVSGVVVAVGEGGATGPDGPLRPGDEVIAYRVAGGYAQRLTVAGSAVLGRPADLGAAEAAGLLLTAATALHGLEAVGLASGETVLIHGAAGGVGQQAVQLAVHRGARVIGTASPRRHDRLSALGALPVAYGDGLLERVRDMAGPVGVDAAVDASGTTEALAVSLAVVTQPGRIATIANFGPDARAAGIKLLGGGPGADPGTDIRQAARSQLVKLAAAGVLQVHVAAAFPLEDAAEAHRLVLTGHAEGKVILTNES